MSQSVLIVAISLMAAVVVGSSVFFVWTLVERLSSRSRATESADVSNNEEQTESDEPGQDT